jgi:hypothetical protein
MQRLYEWRASFGSTAMCIINAFFESNMHDDDFTTNDDRMAFSQYMLKNLRFLYLTADGDDLKVSIQK